MLNRKEKYVTKKERIRAMFWTIFWTILSAIIVVIGIIISSYDTSEHPFALFVGALISVTGVAIFLNTIGIIDKDKQKYMNEE